MSASLCQPDTAATPREGDPLTTLLREMRALTALLPGSPPEIPVRNPETARQA